MAKLVENAAKHVKEWPNGVNEIHQYRSGGIWSLGLPHVFLCDTEVSSDFDNATVTRAQWEAERARILAESQQERDPFIKELVEIACGKLSKEDQELWDKVASDSLQSYLNLCDLSGSVEKFAERAANMADAFMAARAKRMKG